MGLGLTARLTKVLTFLYHVRDPVIWQRLQARGFDQAELDEGWRLFTTASGARLSYRGSAEPTPVKGLLRQLDDWENAWFPVIDATLERHYPALHEALFFNLSQTRGQEVIVSVGTLLDRIDAAALGERGQQALVLLARRGLTPAVWQQARDLLDTLKRGATDPGLQVDAATRAQQQRALDELWSWYREWTRIARTVIGRGDLLLRLGLRRPGRRSGDGEGAEPRPFGPNETDDGG